MRIALWYFYGIGDLVELIRRGSFGICTFRDRVCWFGFFDCLCDEKALLYRVAYEGVWIRELISSYSHLTHRFGICPGCCLV